MKTNKKKNQYSNCDCRSAAATINEAPNSNRRPNNTGRKTAGYVSELNTNTNLRSFLSSTTTSFPTSDLKNE